MSCNGIRASLVLCVFSLAAVGCAASPPSVIRLNPVPEAPAVPSVSVDASVIQSREQLTKYLASTPISESPLGYFKPESRQLFLDNLVFTNLGVGSFRYAELKSELKPDQIYQVLALFGLQEKTALVTSL